MKVHYDKRWAGLLCGVALAGSLTAGTDTHRFSIKSIIIPSIALFALWQGKTRLLEQMRARTRAFEALHGRIQDANPEVVERIHKHVLNGISKAETMIGLRDVLRPLVAQTGGYRYIDVERLRPAIRYQVWEIATNEGKGVIERSRKRSEEDACFMLRTYLDRIKSAVCFVDHKNGIERITNDPDHDYYAWLGLDWKQFRSEIAVVCDREIKKDIEKVFDRLDEQIKKYDMCTLRIEKRITTSEDIECLLKDLELHDSLSFYRESSKKHLAAIDRAMVKTLYTKHPIGPRLAQFYLGEILTEQQEKWRREGCVSYKTVDVEGMKLAFKGFFIKVV